MHQPSPGGCRPDAPCRIGKNMPHFEVGETIRRIHDVELPGGKGDEATSRCTNPEGSVAIEGERAQPVGGQPICLLVDLDDVLTAVFSLSSLFPAHQSVFARGPDGTVARLGKGPDPAAIHQRIVERALEVTVPISGRPTAVTDP